MRPMLVVSLVAASVVVAGTPLRTQKPKPSPRPPAVEAVDFHALGPGTQTSPRASRLAAVPAPGPSSLTAATCTPGSPLAGSSVKTFGYYNAATHTAVENEVWTFDHGGGGWEGWTQEDLTENTFTAFQRVTAASWSAHPNVPAAPLIAGSGSIWLGFHEDEADSVCWDAGLGYGNHWTQRFISPVLTNSSGSSVLIEFDYWYDSEPGYDRTAVIINNGSTETTIATFDGQNGSPGSPLSFSQVVAVTGVFRVIFEFTSDAAWSDEDDLYSTYLGPFGMDNFDITGLEGISGPPLPHDFDTSLEGWIPAPTPGVGDYAALNDFAGYGVSGCGQDGNVVSFHDGADAHPAGQHERVTSPPVDVSSYGTSPLNVWAEYDIYADTPVADSLFWTWGFQYYPYVCAATGDSIWSPPNGPPYVFYHASPTCRRYRSFANDLGPAGVGGAGTTLVPAGADSVRFYLEVLSWYPSATGNVTPLFDNVVIGVSDATGLLHVPSPQYPTIQEGINAAGPGDSVVVRAGTYTGALNRDLDFDGTNLVLLSEGGPLATVIDCERLGRAFHFHNFETAASVVDGFTMIHGTQAAVGSVIYVTTSSPTIRNCIVRNTTVTASTYGVVRMDSGSPTFDCFVVEYDTTTSSGGVVRINGGSPDFNSCTVANNQASFSCVALAGGSPTLTDCDVVDNTTSIAVLASTASTLVGCAIDGNSGLGMLFAGAAASSATACSFSNNLTGGIAIEGNSSTFTSCLFQSNKGPGIEITNVGTFAAQAPERSSSSASGVAGTSPYFLDCTISGNVNTSSSGGGVRFNCNNVPVTTFAPVYDNCIITGNSTLFSGGGIAVCGHAISTDIAPMFQNCTVAANNAGDHGGGIYVAVDNGGSETYAGIATMSLTIMWDNCANGMGDAAYMEADNFLSIECSNFDPNAIEGTGQLLEGPLQTYGDPSFCGASECDPLGTIEGNFALEIGSPADSVNSPCGLLIGANPVLCGPPIGVGDTPTAPAVTALWQNVPNPFNPTTTIRFDLARGGRVTLDVYDVRGRLVRGLVDARFPASVRSVTWDGTDGRGRQVATGVYFARLVAGDVVETRKMVMIK